MHPVYCQVPLDLRRLSSWNFYFIHEIQSFLRRLYSQNLNLEKLEWKSSCNIFFALLVALILFRSFPCFLVSTATSQSFSQRCRVPVVISCRYQPQECLAPGEACQHNNNPPDLWPHPRPHICSCLQSASSPAELLAGSDGGRKSRSRHGGRGRGFLTSAPSGSQSSWLITEHTEATISSLAVWLHRS